MDFNPNNSRHLEVARREVRAARASLERFRDNRKFLFRDYVGDLWEKGRTAYEKSQERVVVPLMAQAISTYVMLLAGNRPHARITTKHRSLHAFARIFESTVNNYLEDVCAEEVFRACVLEAMFSMGVLRTGLLPAGQTEYGDPGRPGMESISFDDWFHDTRAKSFKKIAFCGHFYESSLTELKRDDSLDQEAVKRLRADRRPSSDMVDPDPVKDIEAGDEWDDFDDVTVLVDIWRPREKRLYTFDHGVENLLAVRDWKGPDDGPYRILRFLEVPDSIMGLPGIYGLSPLFRMINSIVRKLARQAMNTKRFTVVNQQSDPELESRVRKTNDGEVLGVDDMNHLNAFATPGLDSNLSAFGIHLQDLFNRSSGNYEHLAGLGPSADTASQEKIISGNVGAIIAKMQSEVANFSRGAMADLGHFIWHDEVLAMPGELPFRDPQLGVEISIPFEWLPGDRQGDYFDYNFQVSPYSMAFKSPAEQSAALTGVFSQLILPMLPSMQEQGIGVDFSAFLESLSRLSDLPELREMITVQQPPSNAPAGPRNTNPGNRSPVQHKTYTRRSVSTGGTADSRRAATVAAMDGSATPQEMGLVSAPG